MATKTKPIVVIVVAVALAAGVAIYLSRQTSASSGTASSTNVAPTSGGGHIRGKASAPVTLVEFGDYQCPACGSYYPMIEELLRRHPDKVKLEFHHYPLIQVHAHALDAAKAAEAAGDQGKYWEMHDLLYQHQREWSNLPNTDAQFLAYAADLGLDANKFMQATKSLDVERRVLEDVKRGVEANVEGTPTFYINGRSLNPLPVSVDEFTSIIDTTLQAAK